MKPLSDNEIIEEVLKDIFGKGILEKFVKKEYLDIATITIKKAISLKNKQFKTAVEELNEELNNALKMGFENYNINDLKEEIDKIFGTFTNQSPPRSGSRSSRTGGTQSPVKADKGIANSDTHADTSSSVSSRQEDVVAGAETSNLCEASVTSYMGSLKCVKDDEPWRCHNKINHMLKDWEVNNLNKHILISAYELGKKNHLSKEILEQVNMRLDVIIELLSKKLKQQPKEGRKK